MLFRLTMATTLLLVAVYVEAVSEHLLPVNPLYFLIVATYVLTLIHAFAIRWVANRVLLVYAQVIGDLLVVTGLVYVTGGIRAGFMLLYPLSVLSGAVLLYRGGGLILAGVATSFYAAIVWAVRSGLIPPQGLADAYFLPAKVLVYSVFVTGVACATVSLIGSYLAESLRHAGEKLELAAEEVADLRGLNEVIVNSIHSGLLTTDSSGRIDYVNEFGAGVLGHRLGEIRGRTVSDVFGSWLLDPPVVQARASNRALSRLELSYERPGGEWIELGVSVSALATSGPRHGGQLLVFQELTEIKRLEYEVRIKEKLAAVGEMAAHLAHEIRNPLGSISGSAQVLMAEANDPDQERLLAIITRESKRLSDTLNRFLFQARPPSVPADPVDIGPVISETVTLLRNGPEVGPGHAVRFEADAGPHLCLADRDQIVQVFWNLVRNGLEAMPDGGVLHVQLGHEDDDLVIVVRDQGRGMAGEDQRRMFEPFQSRSPMGTGLGLAIVYRIIREHRGDISVRSSPTLGTEVKVRLPRVPVTVAS